MLTRALLVLLLVLNLGVALWWLARPAVVAGGHDAAVGNAPLLELVDRSASVDGLVAGSATGTPDSPGGVPEPGATPETCHRFGPFPDADMAAGALARLEPRVVVARLRREWPGAGDSWRVYLQAPGVEAAEEAAQRIAGAGFDDYYVVREGADAGIVALGLYRARARADARADSLRKAGFTVQVEPVGGGDPEYWVEVAAAAGFDPGSTAAAVAAPGVEARSCEGLVPVDPAGAR
ncbi:hypothetical protein LY625_05155 [Lysobacter sp. GX 14042]|uniref:hypothetical protein n=1 Tax=Lysobacter sp. GX 14042 TaxID=2907155 RepID=UPI001F1C995F|nr:hypothetical protein [Lysobacter sp. GX 14042]MCE7032009.1 hypothetical protein [Lysobacter sp. GX 14042]